MSSTAGRLPLRLTRADALVVLLLAAWTAAQAVLAIGPAANGQVVVVAETGQLGPYALDEDRVMEVRGPLGRTEVVVAAGAARIAASDCPNQLCVHRGWVRRPGEVSVCIPNRVVLRVEGRRTRGDLDGVSR